MSDDERTERKEVDSRIENLLNQVVMIYLGCNTVFGSVRDGILRLKTYVTPGAFILTTVFPERGGFLITTRYLVGTKVGRLGLIEEVNRINNELRQGGMYVDEDGGLEFRTFIPDSGDSTPEEIVNGVKMSVATFLENLNEIMDVISSMEGLSDDDFVIMDVDDTNQGASS